MLEQHRLREQFQVLLDQEQRALAAYAELASKVHDPSLRDKVEELRRDKARHVELAERLLEIVE
jgi:rubrerythrin